MKIEIQELGKMSVSGDAVLNALQNNKTPKADLFVRESIQNSLDAAKTYSTSVGIEIEIGTFNSSSLTEHLEVVGPKLYNDYPGEQEFLSFRDYNTTGLTGVTEYSQVVGKNKGNFLKLVYGIANPQDKEESGGSWGYGKTIYYRMGIGLVVFYTRILNESEEYEERLVVAMVEDQNKSRTYIPPREGTSAKTGIAWWGALNEEGVNIPVTDSGKIHEILSIFNIKPYKNFETGTLVVMPYVDQQEILTNNAVELDEGKSVEDMYTDLETYLKYSIQRWYAPRLNNTQNRFNSTALEATINEEKITNDEIDQYFKVIRDMYNYAKHRETGMYFSGVDIEKFKVADINLQGTSAASFSDNTVGYFVYGMFSYDELGMMKQIQGFNPYYLSNITGRQMDESPAIITYCRRPGMMINYEIQNEWSRNISATEPYNYVLGVFVLNSDSNITLSNEEVVTLEEYVRKSEQADHIDWEDHNKLGDPQTIIRRLKNGVFRELNREFVPELDYKHTSNADRLSEVAASYILPKEGFGKGKPTRTINPSRKSVQTKTKTINTELYLDEIEYDENFIHIPYRVRVMNDNLELIYFELKIEQENGLKTLVDYEDETDKHSPVEIAEVLIKSVNKNPIHRDQFFSKIDIYETLNRKIYKEEYFAKYANQDVIEGTITIISDVKSILPKIDIKGKERV